jgi:hypothetical protein
VADVTTTVSAPAYAHSRGKVIVLISFTNNGPVSAANVGYTVTLPAGLTNVSCTGTGISCTYSGTTVSVTGLPTSLTAAQTVTFNLIYTAPNAGSTVTVSTGISTNTPQGLDTAPNSASGSTTIMASLDCDVNGDGKIDIDDINLIFAARGQASSGPSDQRDLDGDGLITVNDARGCVLRCDKDVCAK